MKVKSKKRVDFTPSAHRSRFSNAIKRGIQKAVPSRRRCIAGLKSSKRFNRIEAEYKAFCEAKAARGVSLKINRKITNKKKRRACREACDKFVRSAVLTTFLRLTNQGGLKQERHNPSTVETFAVVYDVIRTIFFELVASRHCEFCDREFANEEQLRNHVRRQHLVNFGNRAFQIVLFWLNDVMSGYQNLPF